MFKFSLVNGLGMYNSCCIMAQCVLQMIKIYLKLDNT